MPASLSDSSQRILVVLRHAKAEAYAAEDHDRRLTDRGRREAQALGRWLADGGFVPVHALVSSAARTQETWAVVAATMGLDPAGEVSDAAYSAGSESSLELVRGLPEEAGVAAYVGHNPTVSSLALALDDGQGEPDAFRALAGGLTTAGAAVLAVPTTWADLAPGGCHLLAVHPTP